MQIKNKIVFITFITLTFFSSILNVFADEFDISAEEILFDKSNNIITGKGSVEALDSEGKVIKADKIIYKKAEEFLIAEGSVEIIDKEGNIFKTDKATYDKPKEIIQTFENSEFALSDGYKIISNQILYNVTEKIVSSNELTTLSDMDGNLVEVELFQHNLEKNIFSSVGKIKIVDVSKNKYFFKELYVDTKKRQMIGSDVSVLFDQESFGVKKENDPRFKANQIFMTDNKTELSKAIFTVCKIGKDKCPPWSLQAKKISHDKTKKTIYYDNATLKFYDIPIFYFPKFFHPDPTVKRQSGFLMPFFTNSTNVGTGFGLPYYWAISKDKDITFTPKIYTKENMLFFNEYRQAFENGFLTLDTSYTQGYKNTDKTKSGGSRNHIFAKLDLKFGDEKNYNSDLLINIEKVSNDTYLRVHDINTSLVKSENTNLKNKIDYNFSKGDMFLNISGTIYENLRVKTNDRYEYIPNIIYGKTFFTERYGTFDFKSDALYKNYETDKHLSSLTNDIVWSPGDFISKTGWVNTIQGALKNINYNAKNTSDYKTAGTVNELSSVFSYKRSLPMKKEGTGFSNIFTPNLMVRYAPGHMRNIAGNDLALKYSNLYSINKTTEIESGLSAVLGFDFTKNTMDTNNNEIEKLSISMGQVFSAEKNKDIPSNSSLDQRMSDIVGEMNYNFSQMGKINYKFALDHNFNDINYNEISTVLNFGKVTFNLDYLEERNHIGKEHYVNTGVNLKLNENNHFKFETKKNYRTDSTELYDLSYQYINDCLTAGLVYRREFYNDSDIDNKDTLMFTISFIPFGGVSTPAIINP